MAITISILAQELGDVVLQPKEGRYAQGSFSHFLLFDDCSLYDDIGNEIIFIVRSEQLRKANANLEKNSFIVYLDKAEDAEMFLNNNNCLVITDKISFTDLVNKVAFCFSTYIDWEHRLINACHPSISLQRMIDIGFERIKTPMSIINMNYQVLAINKNVKLKETGDVLYRAMISGLGYKYVDVIKESNHMLQELGENQSKEFISNIDGNRIKIVSFSSKESFSYYLMLHNSDPNSFPQHTLDLFRVLVKYFKRKAKYMEVEDTARGNLFEQFLQDVVSSSKLNDDEIMMHLTHFGFERYDTFRLYRIAFKSAAPTGTLKVAEIMNKIDKGNKRTNCFVDESRVGILVDSPSTQEETRIREIMAGYNCICTYSSLFHDFCDLPKVWAQLSYVFKHWNKEKGDIQSNGDYLIDECVEVVNNNIPIETVTHPDLLKLSAYDKEKQTDYLSTLLLYIQNNCSVHLTAEKMFIHRNSLHYRIKKIGDILGYDIATSPRRYDILFSSFFVKDRDLE